jgi:teichuronic acid biosynthesis glycosyltransferase TuaC
LRIVTFSSLFPNPAQPGLGLFVAERLRHLLAAGTVDARVVAPVPWFPSRHARFGKYADFAKVPAESTWEGLPVLHPKHLVIPGPGWYLTPRWMAWSAAAALRRLRADGYDFDLIDAHYYYPDGVAAALLGKWSKRPVVITARGSDVNLIPHHALARRMMLQASRSAAQSIAVSAALKDAMIARGMAESRISVLRNGVDLKRFRTLDRTALRSQLGLDCPTLLSAGNLIELKGHHLIIEALVALPEWHLVIAGKGPLEAELKRQATQHGLADRVRFAGSLSQQHLIEYYNAADALVLASSREGMPNVVLEAMACGLPVIATAVGGAPEVLDARLGRLIERSVPAIVAAVRSLAVAAPQRAAVRRHAEQFDWDATTRGQLEVFGRALRTWNSAPCSINNGCSSASPDTKV